MVVAITQSLVHFIFHKFWWFKNWTQCHCLNTICTSKGEFLFLLFCRSMHIHSIKIEHILILAQKNIVKKIHFRSFVRTPALLSFLATTFYFSVTKNMAKNKFDVFWHLKKKPYIWRTTFHNNFMIAYGFLLNSR